MKEEFNELVELFKEDLSWICEECFEIAWCNKYTYKEGQREVKKLINRYFKYFNKQLNKDGNYQKAWSMLGKLFTVAYEQYVQKKRKETNGEIVTLAKIKEHKINKGVFLALQKSGYSQSGLAQKLNLDNFNPRIPTRDATVKLLDKKYKIKKNNIFLIILLYNNK